MSLFTLRELHEKTAEHVSALIANGYEIDTENSVSDNPAIFNVVLTKGEFIVEIHTSLRNDGTFKRLILIKNSVASSYNTSLCAVYYKVHDDIYSDDEAEAQCKCNSLRAYLRR